MSSSLHLLKGSSDHHNSWFMGWDEIWLGGIRATELNKGNFSLLFVMCTQSKSKRDLNETHTTWNLKIFLLLLYSRKVSFLIFLNSQIDCATRCRLVSPFPTWSLPARHCTSLSSFLSIALFSFHFFGLLLSLILLKLPLRSWSFPGISLGPLMPYTLPGWSQLVLMAPTTIFWPRNPVSVLPH